MCSRYSASRKITGRAAGREGLFEWGPRFNIAPSQEAAVETTGGFELMRWGLIPSWASEPSPLINARAETLAQKASFRGPFEKRRCLIPADGFYEWKKYGKHRIPQRFVLRSDELFAFAGLWDEWKGTKTFTIVTTDANALVRGVHERMPVILAGEAAQRWLEKPDQELLKPFDPQLMRGYEVKSLLTEGPENIEEVPASAPELPF